MLEISAQTFTAVKDMMADYIESTNGEQKFEAYLTIPSTYTLRQRELIKEAASMAGIEVIKLIEEPVALLHNSRRLENNGWVSILDAGTTLRHSLVRIFDGRADVFDDSYIEIPEMIELADSTFYDYLFKRSQGPFQIPWMQSTRNQIHKIFDISKDHLMHHHEYHLPDDSPFKRSLPYISREQRYLKTFVDIAKFPIEKKLKPIIERNVPLESVTHTMLVGGNSLAYPAISTAVEDFWRTRLGDTVSNPTHGLVVGAAIKAGIDQGYTSTILRGRGIDELGCNYITDPHEDTIQHQVNIRKGSGLPFLSALTFSNVAAYQPTFPLLPAFQEEHVKLEEILKPHPAVSFTVQPDPLSGEPEYWARVSVQAPKPPPPQPDSDVRDISRPYPFYRLYSITDPMPTWMIKEMIADSEPTFEEVLPDLNLCFVVNLSCEPLHDTSMNVPENSTSLDEILAEHPDGERLRSKFFKHEDKIPEGVKDKASASVSKLLHTIQDHKDSKHSHHRILNRAHDMVQFILSNLTNDDKVSLVTLGSNGPEKHHGLMPLDYLNKMKSLNTIRDANTLGRASERFAEGIIAAHKVLEETIKKKEDFYDIMKENEQLFREIEQEILDMEYKKDHGVQPISFPDSRPENWHYPLISKDLYSMWWSLLQNEKELTNENIVQPYNLENRSMTSESEDSSEEPEKGEEEPLKFLDVLPQTNTTYHRDVSSLKTVQIAPKLEFVQGILQRMNARKEAKALLGKQFRIVMITDGQPDPSTLKKLEESIQNASKDNIGVTILSIDGPDFEGEFLRILSRAKGARTLRLYQQYLWSTAFREEWHQTNKLYQSISDPLIKNLSCKIEFKNYSIEKIYGSYLTPQELSRTEKMKDTGTIRFKIGSLYPSYDVYPRPLEDVPDKNAFLVKLKRKDTFLSDRESNSHWKYDPEADPIDSTKNISLDFETMPSVNSPVNIELQWVDLLGKKNTSSKTLRITDYNTPLYYADEPGVVELVKIANFVEVMTKLLHQTYQQRLSGLPDFPCVSLKNDNGGLNRLSLSEETKLYGVYRERANEITKVASDLLFSGTLIPEEYKEFYNHIYRNFFVQTIKDKKSNYDTDILQILFSKYSSISDLPSYSIGKSAFTTFSTLVNMIKSSENLPQLPEPKWSGYQYDQELFDPYMSAENAYLVTNEIESLKIYPASRMLPVDPNSVWSSRAGYSGIDKVMFNLYNKSTHSLENSSGTKLLSDMAGPEWKQLEAYYNAFQEKFSLQTVSTSLEDIVDLLEQSLERDYMLAEVLSGYKYRKVIPTIENYLRAYVMPKLTEEKRSSLNTLLDQLKRDEDEIFPDETDYVEPITFSDPKRSILEVIQDFTLAREQELGDHYAKEGEVYGYMRKGRKSSADQILYQDFLNALQDGNVEIGERLERFAFEKSKFMKEHYHTEFSSYDKTMETFREHFFEVDWDARFDKLKEQAKIFTRRSFLEGFEIDRHFRSWLREKMTKIAQTSVDSEIFAEMVLRKQYTDKLRTIQTEDVELMLDIEDEIYNYKMDYDPSLYALSVWIYYKKLQTFYDPPTYYFRFAQDPIVNQKYVDLFVDMMKELKLINETEVNHYTTKEVWNPPLLYTDDNFFDVEYDYDGVVRDYEAFAKLTAPFNHLGDEPEDIEETETSMVVSSGETEVSEETPDESVDQQENSTSGDIEEAEEFSEVPDENVEESPQEAAGDAFMIEVDPEVAKNVLSELFSRDHFDTDWDYIQFLEQNAERPLPFSDQEYENEPEPFIFTRFYDTKTNTFDWDSFVEFDKKIIRKPKIGKITKIENSMVFEDNLGPIDLEKSTQLELEQNPEYDEAKSVEIEIYPTPRTRLLGDHNNLEDLEKDYKAMKAKIDSAYYEDILFYQIKQSMAKNNPIVKTRYEKLIETWRMAKKASTWVKYSNHELNSMSLIKDMEMFDRAYIDDTYPLMKVMKFKFRLPHFPGLSFIAKPIEEILLRNFYIPIPGAWPIEMARSEKIDDYLTKDYSELGVLRKNDVANPYIQYPYNEQTLYTDDEIQQKPNIDLATETSKEDFRLVVKIHMFAIERLQVNIYKAFQNLFGSLRANYTNINDNKNLVKTMKKLGKIIEILSSGTHIQEFTLPDDAKPREYSFSDLISNIKSRFESLKSSLSSKSSEEETSPMDINDIRKIKFPLEMGKIRGPGLVDEFMRDLSKCIEDFNNDISRVQDLMEELYEYEGELQKEYIMDDKIFETINNIKSLRKAQEQLMTTGKEQSIHDQEAEKQEDTENNAEEINSEMKPDEESEKKPEDNDSKPDSEMDGEAYKYSPDSAKNITFDVKDSIPTDRPLNPLEIQNIVLKRLKDLAPVLDLAKPDDSTEIQGIVTKQLELTNRLRQKIEDDKSDFDKKYFKRYKMEMGEYRLPKNILEPPEYPLIEFDPNAMKTEKELEEEMMIKEERRRRRREARRKALEEQLEQEQEKAKKKKSK